MLPKKHVVTIHIAMGASLVLGALGGQTLTNEDMEKNSLLVASIWITGSSLMETTVSTSGEVNTEYDDLEHACSM